MTDTGMLGSKVPALILRPRKRKSRCRRASKMGIESIPTSPWLLSVVGTFTVASQLHNTSIDVQGPTHPKFLSLCTHSKRGVQKETSISIKNIMNRNLTQGFSSKQRREGLLTHFCGLLFHHAHTASESSK